MLSPEWHFLFRPSFVSELEFSLKDFSGREVASGLRSQSNFAYFVARSIHRHHSTGRGHLIQ